MFTRQWLQICSAGAFLSFHKESSFNLTNLVFIQFLIFIFHVHTALIRRDTDSPLIFFLSLFNFELDWSSQSHIKGGLVLPLSKTHTSADTPSVRLLGNRAPSHWQALISHNQWLKSRGSEQRQPELESALSSCSSLSFSVSPASSPFPHNMSHSRTHTHTHLIINSGVLRHGLVIRGKTSCVLTWLQSRWLPTVSLYWPRSITAVRVCSTTQPTSHQMRRRENINDDEEDLLLCVSYIHSI